MVSFKVEATFEVVVKYLQMAFAIISMQVACNYNQLEVLKKVAITTKT